MGLTGITLVLVSLAFFGSAAAHDCQNGTRPASQKNREGCDFYCWNTGTNTWDKFFFEDGQECFYNDGGRGTMSRRIMSFEKSFRWAHRH
uniref:Basic tail protein n=1 Tax=Ixodes ricinus TaxID=34613 RepID=V5IF04_IXORI